jgi:hypothetical protein
VRVRPRRFHGHGCCVACTMGMGGVALLGDRSRLGALRASAALPACRHCFYTRVRLYLRRGLSRMIVRPPPCPTARECAQVQSRDALCRAAEERGWLIEITTDRSRLMRPCFRAQAFFDVISVVGRVNCSRPEGLVLHYVQVLPLRASPRPGAASAACNCRLSATVNALRYRCIVRALMRARSSSSSLCLCE